MKTACLALLVTLFVSETVVMEEKSVFVSNELGFSIEPPIAGESDVTTQMVAYFYLPPIDGFAGNVNIQKQVYKDTIEAYDKLSFSQFENMKFSMIKRTLTRNEVRYEYTGKMRGRTLHWYARAVKREEHVLLVTATALEGNWESQKTELMKSVDSFMVRE
jgi:hypothetical protein